MCGIVGVVSHTPVNQLIYDALLLLQHRGQDAAGIVTQQGRKFFMHKAKGMVRDVWALRASTPDENLGTSSQTLSEMVEQLVPEVA